MTVAKLSFEQMLTGGHPNSLGRTVEVVDIVVADQGRLHELYQCYFSDDEIVRLRVSNAMKRVCAVHPEWLVPYLDSFLTDISQIEQASTQWTLAQLFLSLEANMNAKQHKQAVAILKANLQSSDDWIVQNTTIETLGTWASSDQGLKKWLIPKLEEFTSSHRKSVANRAAKVIESLTK